MECIAKISGTEDWLQRMKPEGHEVLDEQIAEKVREVAKRGPFRFRVCGIPVGSELVFIDDASICVTVVDDRRIKYDGEITSVSALDQRLKGFDHPVQGTLWFTYKGEKLTDIRDRLEAEQK